MRSSLANVVLVNVNSAKRAPSLVQGSDVSQKVDCFLSPRTPFLDPERSVDGSWITTE